MSEYSELLKKMENWKLDVLPDGWPAIQMKDITTLCQMIEGAKILMMSWDRDNRIKWNKDGYWFDKKFVGDLVTAFYEAGKTTKKVKGKETLLLKKKK